MKRWMVVGTMAVAAMALLAGATMFTVARAQAQASGAGPGMHGGPGMGGSGMHRGPGMHPEMMRRMISLRLDEALTQAAVTPEQRVKIHESRDRAFKAMEAQRPDPRSHRDQLLAAFEADRLDVTQVQAMHAQMEQQHQAMRSAMSQAIVEIHDTLTPAQRKIVADYARAHEFFGRRP
jgi:Spy/CpxP family protein refolding chaperone